MPVSKSGKVPLTVWLPEDLAMRVRNYADRNDVKISRVVARLLGKRFPA